MVSLVVRELREGGAYQILLQKKLNPTEQNYITPEKELMAMMIDSPERRAEVPESIAPSDRGQDGL